MEEKKEIFQLAEEWKRSCWTEEMHCVVWGTGQVAREVTETLRLLNVPIFAYGDNDEKKQGTIFCGKSVLSAGDLQKVENPCLLIGSYVIRPVYEQLQSLGFRDIFVLLDTLKYPVEEVRRDRELLAPYFAGDLKKLKTGKVLVEVYGDIGDVLIKIGLLHKLETVLGKERMSILVEDSSVSDVLQTIFRDVMAMPRAAFVNDPAARMKFLQMLNRRYYSRSIILCDPRLHANRRLLHRYNFNVPETCFSKRLPDSEYLPELDREFLAEFFPEFSEGTCSPKHLLDDVIEAYFPEDLPFEKKSYVVVNLGANKEVRHYDPMKFLTVISFLQSREIPIVLVGKGEYDASWAVKIREGSSTPGLVCDRVNRYGLLESIAAVRFARLFVGTDSGMWNAAYVVDTPSVVLYGFGEYGCFMHKDPRVCYVMAEDRSCMGCRWYCGHRSAAGYAMCLDAIAPERIIEKIREALNEAG